VLGASTITYSHAHLSGYLHQCTGQYMLCFALLSSHS
jgi:hypothetical protein